MKENYFLDMEMLNFLTEHEIQRRQFLKLLGTGIMIVFTAGNPLMADQRRQYPTDVNAYLKIDPDGKVTCYTGKVELGQGAITSLAQIAADELGVSFEDTKMVLGDTDLCPYDMGTFGSMTTRFFAPALRSAAAKAKRVMIDLAAEHLSVAVEDLEVENGVVYVKSDRSKSVSYGKLADGKKIAKLHSDDAALLTVEQFKIMGKPYLRVDSIEKVTGQAKYAGDIRLPGMKYAKILRPPAHKAMLKNAETTEAEKQDGVTLINEDGIVAILHNNPEAAAHALAMIDADWDIPQAEFSDKDVFENLLKKAPEGQISEEEGSLKKGASLARESFESEFTHHYIAHSPMETHTAIADVKGGKATVWIATQTPFGNKSMIARALEFPEENVRVITPYVGGGFGGKTGGFQAVEAAKLSKIAGVPVQVAWTREEEFFYDNFMPAAIIKIKSGIDGDNRITNWDYNVYHAGSRGSDQFYDIPHFAVKSAGSWGQRSGTSPHPFGVGAWRAPGANTNVFAKECQIDIMASNAGIDPVEFRLNNLKDKRMRKVLETVTDKYGWKSAPAPSGRGVGVALGIDAGTFVGALADVEVNKTTGHVQVNRVVVAQDMGIVINPEGAIIQMEGCITMGLGYSLSEMIHFNGGEVLDTNFDTYEIPRFSWLPKIETHLIENNELSPQGGGEPTIVTMGAVIGNAIFDATGARLFQLPMTPEQVLEAIQSEK